MDVRGTAMTDVTAHARSVFSPGRPTSSSHFFLCQIHTRNAILIGDRGSNKPPRVFFLRNSIAPHFARLIYVDMFALPQTKVAGRIVVNHSLSDRDTVID